jgi:hypothetical protein
MSELNDATAQLLLDTGRQLAAGEIIKPEREPAHIYYIRKPDGELERVESAKLPANNKAASLATIVELALKEDEAVIWYSQSGVVLKHGDGRGLTKLELPLSAQLTTLKTIAGTRYTQADIIKLFRITFAKVVDQSVIAILRKIKFAASTSGESTVEHGKTSLGKLINAEVTGQGILPETLVFNVPFFESFRLASIRVSIECALEPSAETATFQVIPLPGEIDAAIAKAEDALRALILNQFEDGQEVRVPILNGTPGDKS